MNEEIKRKNEKGETLKAGCVIVNDKDEVLLVSGHGQKVWAFPKGHMEHGESPEQAAIRETKEETGYDVLVVGRLSDAAYVQGKTGELIRVLLFRAMPLGTPDVAETKTRSAWFSKEEARRVLAPNLVPLLDELE
jgi:ADP-ribose pyrophosphatase YjhB (NUDIX family)